MGSKHMPMEHTQHLFCHFGKGRCFPKHIVINTGKRRNMKGHGHFGTNKPFPAVQQTASIGNTHGNFCDGSRPGAASIGFDINYGKDQMIIFLTILCRVI